MASKMKSKIHFISVRANQRHLHKSSLSYLLKSSELLSKERSIMPNLLLLTIKLLTKEIVKYLTFSKTLSGLKTFRKTQVLAC